MTELALVLGLATVALGLAFYLVRWILAREVGDAEMNRVANQIRVAAEGFARRQSGTTLALSSLLGGGLFLAFGLRFGEHDRVGGLELGVWLTLSFAVGAGLTVLVGQIATFLATRSAIRVAAGARRSVDQALVISLRGGGVIGLVATAASPMAVATLTLAIGLYHSRFGEDPAALARILPHVPHLVTGLSLGACFATLLIQLSGKTFSKASDLGGDLGATEIGLVEDAAQNPASIADLAGDSTGECGARACQTFATAMTVDWLVMIGASAIFEANVSEKSALALLVLPVLARTFSVLAAAFGVMIVRTDDTEEPESASFRGFLVTMTLHSVALIGAIKWLMGASWLPAAGAALVGCGVGVLLQIFSRVSFLMRFRPVRDVAEAARSGVPINILTALYRALDASAAPIVLTIATLVLATWMGQETGLVEGGTFGIALATMGLSGSLTYLATAEAAATLNDAASGIVGMTLGDERPEVRGRLLVLDALGNAAKGSVQSHTAVISILVGVLGAWSLSLEAARRAALEGTAPIHANPSSSPWIVIAALCGVMTIAWLGARSIGLVTRGARRVLDEVRRQLEGRDHRKTGLSASPVDHGPCVELASRFALRYSALPGFLSIFALVLLALVLRLARTEGKDDLTTDCVAAFVVAATIAGAFGTLVVGYAGGSWANAKKYILTGAHGGRLLTDATLTEPPGKPRESVDSPGRGSGRENPVYVAAATGDMLGDPLKDTAASVWLAFIRVLPALALVVQPFW